FGASAFAQENREWWRTGSRRPADRKAEKPAGESDEDVAATETAPPAVLLPGICICVVLLTAIIVWPQVRHSGAGSGGEPAITVAVIQGNVPRLGLDFNAQRREVLD